MSVVKYTRLPTEDVLQDSEEEYVDDSIPSKITIDYGSAFTYNTPGSHFKSVFTFTGSSTTRDLSSLKNERKEDAFSIIIHAASVILCYIIFILTFPISFWFYVKRVHQYERLVTFRLGRLIKIRGPGWRIVLPIIDKWRIINIRTRGFNIPTQQILLADKSAIEIGAEVQYRIADVVRSVMFIQDLDQSTRTLAQMFLNNLIRPYALEYVKTHKEVLNMNLKDTLNQSTKEWGLEILRIEITQPKVILSSDEKPAIDNFISGLQLGPMLNLGMQQSVQSSSHLKKVNECQIKDSNISKEYEIIAKLRPFLEVQSAKMDQNCTCKLVIQDAEVSIYVTILEGKLTFHNMADSFDMSVNISEENLYGVIDGTLSPLQAYIDGNIEITGNRMLLLQLMGG